MSEPKQKPSYPLRMPDELRQQLEAMAEKQGKSVNALIVSLLSEATQGGGRKARMLSDGELLHEVFSRFGDQVVIGISKELAGQYGTAAKTKKKR